MEIKQSKNFYYRICDGDTMLNICQRFNTCKFNILRNNPSLDLYVGEWIVIKSNEFKTHFVKPMETLLDIATRYRTSKEKITNDNDLKTEKLFIGQRLKIYEKR